MSVEFDDIRKRAVEIALFEATLDTKEVGAKNRGERIDLYLRNAHALKKDAEPDQAGLGWCGMFIYYCYSQAAREIGKILPFKSGTLWSGQKLQKWGFNNFDKTINSCPYVLLPGDIYIMNNYHIGMVIEQVNNLDIVNTIDGNQEGVDSEKNSVRKRTRSVYDMRMLIRI
jgi:hypothetical protein